MNFFAKSPGEIHRISSINEEVKFYLTMHKLKIGELSCDQSEWQFKYSRDFIAHAQEYNLITGFPDINKTYRSQELWPFFKIRIPGLKQPKIKEILKSEQLDATNDAQLLKRFGHKTISNPYELVSA